MNQRQFYLACLFNFVVYACLAYMLLSSGCSKDYSVQVKAKTWTHTTSLRERQIARDGTFWSVPKRAGYYDEPTFNRHCYQKQNGVYCLVEDPKSGQCLAYAPDYDEYCEYSYYEWPVIASKYLSGENHPGTWPSYNPNLENYRESRSAQYFVHLSSQDRAFVYKTDDISRYADFALGDYWKIEVSKLTDKITPVSRQYAEASSK